MGLLDAKEYDPRPAQKRWRLIGIALVVVVVASLLWWNFRFWPEEQVINKFFSAIEHKDLETAYGIYNGDPDWKQHPQKYNQYSLPQFELDWGPSSEYGAIASHHIDCATQPKKKGFASPSGVIVVVTINKRSESTSLWVEKKSKTITISPWTVLCHGPK